MEPKLTGTTEACNTLINTVRSGERQAIQKVLRPKKSRLIITFDSLAVKFPGVQKYH
jgi:hypothetical protein